MADKVQKLLHTESLLEGDMLHIKILKAMRSTNIIEHFKFC